MSTSVNPILKPATVAEISERDFRVCENCGGPAMAHPGTKRISCCACLHNVTRHDNQIWECFVCKCQRAWGTGTPNDAKLKPLLGCKSCGEVTFHSFHNVVRAMWSKN